MMYKMYITQWLCKIYCDFLDLFVSHKWSNPKKILLTKIKKKKPASNNAGFILYEI